MGMGVGVGVRTGEEGPTSENMTRRSCMALSRDSSPVPNSTCSPDSSTLVYTRGYVFCTCSNQEELYACVCGGGGEGGGEHTNGKAGAGHSPWQVTTHTDARCGRVGVLYLPPAPLTHRHAPFAGR
jgi:hypothetical protein